MKSLAIAICITMAITCFCLADPGGLTASSDDDTQDGSQTVYPCPTTKITDNNKCMDCHVLIRHKGETRFGIKEVDPTSLYTKKPYSLDLIWDGTKITPYMLWGEISGSLANNFREAMEYILWHPEFGKRVIIEIHSYGGSLLDAWRIVGIMDYYKKKGITIETRVDGMAMSAGFLLFANGTKGHRLVNPRAEMMWHELWTMAWLSIETPSKKEHEAEVLRHLQDNIHEWLAERSNLTKEELDELVQFKEYWLNGQTMIDVGIADAPLGESL